MWKRPEKELARVTVKKNKINNRKTTFYIFYNSSASAAAVLEPVFFETFFFNHHFKDILNYIFISYYKINVA